MADKHLPVRVEAQRLQGEADLALAEAEALKLPARLEDLTVWEMEKVKQSRKGCKTYTYWIGILARRRQDAQRAHGGRQEDICRGGKAEGLGDESGNVGDQCWQTAHSSILWNNLSTIAQCWFFAIREV